MKIPLPVRRSLLIFDAPPRRLVPSFAGNVWRGAFLAALRESVCRTGAPRCHGCPQRLQGCDFAYLDQTPPESDARRMRLVEQGPHPYLLRELPADACETGRVALRLTLIGRAIGLQPLVIAALARAAVGPAGIAHEHLTLREIRHESSLGTGDWLPAAGRGASSLPVGDDPDRPHADTPPSPSAECPAALRLTFETPLSLRREGRAVAPERMVFADVLGSLLRRVSMLCQFHTATSLELPFAEMTARSRAVASRSELRPMRLWRHSSRQRQAIAVDAVEGWIEIDLRDAAEFWPLLWLGQHVHVGRATSMGLGGYALRVEPVATLRPETATAFDGTMAA